MNKILQILKLILSPFPSFVDKSLFKYFKERKIQFADVGASGGLKEEFYPLKPVTKIISFDPDNRAAIDNSSNVTNYRTGLWSRKEKMKLNLARFPDASSLYKPNAELTKYFPVIHNNHSIVQEGEIDLDALDNLIDYEIDFLKIDVEGAEKEILIGGANSLKNLLGLKIEVRFQEIYIGSPKFFEIHNYLESIGLQLHHMQTNSWSREQSIYKFSNPSLIWADAYYVMNTDKFIQLIKEIASEENRCEYISKFYLILQSMGALEHLQIIQENVELLNETEFRYVLPKKLYFARTYFSLAKMMILLPFLFFGFLVSLPAKKLNFHFIVLIKKYAFAIGYLIRQFGGNDTKTGTITW